jgi:hypothetical protein
MILARKSTIILFYSKINSLKNYYNRILTILMLQAEPNFINIFYQEGFLIIFVSWQN